MEKRNKALMPEGAPKWIGKGQLEGLRAELIAFGFSEKAINQAFKNVETKGA
jgi:hypothetical protein